MEKPVASTPNTPEARSPSEKKLPSGARRRTKSIAPMARPVATATSAAARKRFIAPLPGDQWLGFDRRVLLRPTLEQPPPPGEHLVDLRGADDRGLRLWKVHRREDERPRLCAADPAVERDQLLERAPLVQVGGVEPPDHQVGYV